MNIGQCVFAAVLSASLLSAAPPKVGATQASMVVTVQPSKSGAPTLQPGELTVLADHAPAPVTGLRRLTGDRAGMQLFVLLDDSTRSASLSLHFSELRPFLNSLPPSTEVAVGYMRNGGFQLAQAFTSDHQKAAAALRLPIGVPGENGSPYFALSYLVNHWPSKQVTGRRAVLMLTDGVDRYYGPAIEDDPYVDAACNDALKHGVMVYPIYLRGAGRYGSGSWSTNIAQSRLIQVGEETGGYAYFEDFADPVTIAPFLTDLQQRFDNQYEVTIEAMNRHGMTPVKLHTETPGLKVSGPTYIYLP